MRLPCGVYHQNYSSDHAWWQTKFVWFRMLLLFAVLYLVLPFVVGGYWLTVVNLICYYIIGAFGVQILTGYTGLINIGQAAFMCVGAYTSAILTGKYGVPFIPSVLCAGIMAGLVGIIFGAVSARLKGFYLLMTTLMAQFVIVDYLAIKWRAVTGGTAGMSVVPAQIGPLILDTTVECYFLLVTVVILSTVFVANLMRTRTGRAWKAIRDNDIAAEALGVNIVYYKLVAFFVGCGLGGIAGALWGHTTSYISPEHFPLFQSMWLLAIILIGGMGTIYGVIYGAIFLTFAIEGLRYLLTPLAMAYPWLGERPYYFTEALFGLVIILFLLYQPNGLSYRWWQVKNYFHLWPFSY